MKALAQNCIWWPGKDADIEEKINRCYTCKSSRTSPARAPLHPLEWPRYPGTGSTWTMPTMLIVIVVHSKWIEVYLIGVTNSTTSIEKLRCCFATHSLPDLLVTDKGLCFTGLEFAEFTRNNGINYELVIPYHQASNGLAESSVKIVKSGLRRMSCGTLETKLSRILLSPTEKHSIPQLELHQQNYWLKGSYRQIWTGRGHPTLPLYSSAKIIRNSIITEPPRCGCFTKTRMFLPRTLTVAPDGWPDMFWRVILPYLSR